MPRVRGLAALIMALCLLSACGDTAAEQAPDFSEEAMETFLFSLLDAGESAGVIRFSQTRDHPTLSSDVDGVIYRLSAENGAYRYLVDETRWSYTDGRSYCEVSVDLDYREDTVPLAEIPAVGTQREAVSAILAALEEGRSTVVLTTEAEDWTMDTLKTIGSTAADNAPLGVLYGSYSYGILPEKGGEKRIVTISYESRLDAESRKRLTAELDAAADTLAAELEAQTKQGARAAYRAVHDAVVASAEYDTELRDAVSADTRDEADFVRSTAYGALVEHRTICSGYASAFQLLCDRLELPCWTVVGQAEGEDHSWNLVPIEGETYAVDCTFDDGVGDDTYFLLAPDSPQYSGYQQNETILPW